MHTNAEDLEFYISDMADHLASSLPENPKYAAKVVAQLYRKVRRHGVARGRIMASAVAIAALTALTTLAVNNSFDVAPTKALAAAGEGLGYPDWVWTGVALTHPAPQECRADIF